MAASCASFDFEAQFHHAQEGYSDSQLRIDAPSHMDRRLHRKIAVCQKRFERYRCRTPPPPPPPPRCTHAPNARKQLIKNIPRAFKTLMSRSPVAHSHNVPLRLNRLHGAEHSRLSVLSPSLRQQFRNISYHTPQSSRVLVHLQSSPPSHSPPSDSSSHSAAHQPPQPPEPQCHPLPHPTHMPPCAHTALSASPPQPNHTANPPQQQQRAKPAELPLNISTLINKYDNNNSTHAAPNNNNNNNNHNKVERHSLIPDAQHKFATMRALFEHGATEHKRASCNSAPRSNTTPLFKCTPPTAASQSACHQSSTSPLSSATPPHSASQTNRTQHVSKRHGTRFETRAVHHHDGACARERGVMQTDVSLTSSVTGTPDNDALLHHAPLHAQRAREKRHSQARASPERINLSHLFDSLQLCADEKQHPNAAAAHSRAAAARSSTVATLIARYGGTELHTGSARERAAETKLREARKEQRSAHDTASSAVVVRDDEDEIQKVYKTHTHNNNNNNSKAALAAEHIPQRKGGVEAIPWEARIKSFNAQVEEAASMAYIRKVMSHDAHNDRFLCFSARSGAEHDCKQRATSEASGRRWRTRSARAPNKRWLSRKAQEQVHKVKKRVGAVKNIISADDY